MDTNSDLEAMTMAVTRYADVWGQPDSKARLVQLEQVWTDTAQYTDPNAHCQGREQLDDYIGSAHSRYPGMRIERTSALDAHHDVARFGWRLVLGDGTTAMEGIDFVQFAADGRIGRIVGFFGPLPLA